MDEPWGHYTKWNSIGQIKTNILLSHLHVASKETKLIEREAEDRGWRNWVKVTKGTASSYKIKRFWWWNVQHEEYICHILHYIIESSFNHSCCLGCQLSTFLCPGINPHLKISFWNLKITLYFYIGIKKHVFWLLAETALTIGSFLPV